MQANHELTLQHSCRDSSAVRFFAKENINRDRFQFIVARSALCMLIRFYALKFRPDLGSKKCEAGWQDRLEIVAGIDQGEVAAEEDDRRPPLQRSVANYCS
jgi:hypothetical protein